nr:reverse transcriptase domain-containing protein [Tanacetum cinerariifolium]
MVPATTSLTGFSGKTTWPLGQLRLLVTIGDTAHSTKAWMNFMVVKSLSPYNGIIGQPGLKAIQAVPSTVHGMLKFLTEGGIVTICSSLLIPAECASIGTSSVTPREETTHHTNFTVALHLNFPDQEVVVKGLLSDRGRTELCSLLKKNLDIFAWQPSDMTGVPRSVAEHRLNIREGCPPHDGSWRMCVNFTDLNKACPQDCYPLPEIDWKVESLCGYPFKCFLDAYKGYHQIQLAEADNEKTAFHTGQGVYCYTKMPFGLKNAGATNGAKHRAEQAFQQLKQHLSDLPLLVAPKPQEELIMYLSATHGAISAVMSRPDVAGRLQKWIIMLGEHNITYRPMTSIKGQILADFLNEMLGNASQGVSVAVTQEEPWMLFTDGSSCVDGSAEYEALVTGLRIATQMGVKNVQVNVDYKLVANQVLGTYVAKEDNMVKYLEIVNGLVIGFTTFSISQVPRSRNKKVDALSKIASTSFAHLSKQVLVEVLETKSITGKEVIAVIEEEGPTWMTELVDYLKEGILPRDEKEARKLRLKAHQYELIEGIEAKAVGTITDGQVKKFVWDNIVCRFGIPGEIISDNGKQFVDNPFKDWCDKLNITQRFASIKHPQSNGLVERANRSLGEGIKARLGERNKNWVEELPHVLWAHRTMIKSSHGDTPFSLTYGTEAVIPTEIGMPTYRTVAVDMVNNDEELRLNLDLLEECQELAAMSEAKSKSKMMKYYNARVRGVAFKPGDFVYHSNDASHAVAGGKLGPK